MASRPTARPLGIGFTDEGWEVESVSDDGQAAQMQNVRPGLFLTHVQDVATVPLDDDAVRALFAEAGRPVKLGFAQTSQRQPPAEAEQPLPSADWKRVPSKSRPGQFSYLSAPSRGG